MIHIGIIGHIGRPKGSRIVAELSKALIANKAKLTVVGTTDLEPIEAGRLSITGQYIRSEIPMLIAERHIDLILIPSVVPETFCYVAEEVMSLNLPLAVFDIGAPPERVRLYPRGIVLPICEGEELLQRLLAFARSDAFASSRFAVGSQFAPDVTIVGEETVQLVVSSGARAKNPSAQPKKLSSKRVVSAGPSRRSR